MTRDSPEIFTGIGLRGSRRVFYLSCRRGEGEEEEEGFSSSKTVGGTSPLPYRGDGTGPGRDLDGTGGVDWINQIAVVTGWGRGKERRRCTWRR